MVGLSGNGDNPKDKKRTPMPCETPGCSENCTYAYSCHECRMGRPGAVFWPGLALVLMVAVAAVFQIG